ITNGAPTRRDRGQGPLDEPRNTEAGRICSSCRKRLPAEQFGENNYYPDGLSPYCRTCATTKGRKHRWRDQYGLLPDDFARMLSQQEGRCAICGGEFDGATVLCQI